MWFKFIVVSWFSRKSFKPLDLKLKLECPPYLRVTIIKAQNIQIYMEAYTQFKKDTNKKANAHIFEVQLR